MGLGFRVWMDLRFRVRVWMGLGFRVWGLDGFGV